MRRCLLIALSLLLAASSSEQEELCAEDLIKHLRETYKDWAKANDYDISRKLYETEAPRGPEDGEPEEYDFVIVGIGSAGSVLVNRLSKVSKWKVLALEAGDEPDPLSDIPVFAPLQQFTHHNWGYTTEKQDHIGMGFENQRLHWPRGKGLGGSSLINYMFFTRCNRIDYDRWAKTMGNPGWSYEDVLPYFKAMEDADLALADECRSKGGELPVKYVKFRTKCAELFVEAARQLGYDYVDVNGRVQTGVEFAQANTKDGFRCSGEKAFVRPVKARGNLSLRLNSHVTKILVDGTTKTATGVEYVHKGKTYRIKAAKEVVLCAGAIGSPHILMLSGIGPQDDLEKHGIQVVQDLPVGQKLYDHSTYVGLTFTINESLAYDFSKALELNSFSQLHKVGSGPLESTGTAEALAFIKTEASTEDHPDVELIQLSTHFPTDKGVTSKRAARLADQVYEELYEPLENKTVWSIYPVLLHPKSFGRMELQSADPFIYPKLYANYLSDPEGHDLKTLVAGIREAIRVGESPIMREHGSELVRTKLPGCKSFQFDSDEYWGCAARHLTSTMHHQTTTCKMGPAGDDEAVVDHRLRVHKVKNLRVADASVIPIPLTGHTNAPAYMIGAKAAAMITEDWS